MFLVAIIILLLVAAIDWLFICGIVYMVTFLLDLTFSWSIATVIWLIVLILRSIFQDTKN